MKKQILKAFFAGAALIALGLTACKNGNGPAKGSVIQNDALRDTARTSDNPADDRPADTTHHM